MLIKCQKCGYENQIESIFCRGCGEKLDHSSLTPEKIESNSKKKSGSGHMLRNGITIVILAGIVFLLWQIFFPGNIPEYTESKASFQKEKRALERKKNTSFTPEQLTALFNSEILDNTGTKNDMYTVRHILFRGQGDQLTILVYSALGKLPVVFTFNGKLNKSDAEEDKIAFKLHSLKAGDLTLAIPAMQKMFLHKFDGALRCEAVRNAFNEAENIEFSEGVLKVTFKDEK